MTSKNILYHLGSLDPELIAKTAPAQRVQKNKRSRLAKWVLLSACLALILGAMIALPMLIEDDPGSVLPGPDSGEVPGTSPTPGTDIGQEPGTDVTPGTDIGQEPGTALTPGTDVGEGTDEGSEVGSMPQVEWAFYACIDDPQFDCYALSEYGIFCAPELVGEHCGEIRITARLGPNVTDILADVYAIEGIDHDLCLCIRYRDDGNQTFCDDFLVYDAYHFIYAKSYRFTSLDAMLDTTLDQEEIFLPNYWNYSNGSETEYFLNGNVLDELNRLLLSIDGSGIDMQDGEMLDKVHAEADAFVSSSCRFDGKIGLIPGEIRIYSTGYLYHAAFGGQLFEIGQENAQKIMDCILRKGVTENYEWIESNGIWYPVIYDLDAQYATYSVALNESKLYGQLNFAPSVVYWEQVFGAVYHEVTLSRKTLDVIALTMSDIADLLTDDQGRAVENSEIPGFSASEMLFNPSNAVVLTHQWDVNGDETCTVTVYDSGHIGLSGCYYFIGTEYTDSIFALVHEEYTPSSN